MLQSWNLQLYYQVKAKYWFSLESGGDIPMDVASTCSNQTLMVSGTTGRNDISTSSPFSSMLALCSTWWYSTVFNLVANKGCHNQMFCLVVLINIIGMDLALVLATHLFTVMSSGWLWCSACSRHVTFDGILSVCPGTVMTEFLGNQTGFLFEPAVTSRYVQFYYQNFVDLFLDRSSVFGGFTCSSCWDTVWVDTPNPLPSLASEWW